MVPTALAFSTWAYALSRMDAGKLGVTTYLVPPLVILMGWLLLDEVPPALALVGGAVCLAGVALSRRTRPSRPPVPVPPRPAPRLTGGPLARSAGSEVGARVHRGRQFARHDPPAGDVVRDQPQPVPLLARAPTARRRSPRPRHQLRTVLRADLLRLAADEHAPPAAGAPVDVVDLEGDVGVLRRLQDGPGRSGSRAWCRRARS